jgi:aminoglycoside 2'-N-acetyltransferase I
LGWIRWRGATWCRNGERLTRTTDEDGGVFVLPTRTSPMMTFEEDIAADWRSGEVW